MPLECKLSALMRACCSDKAEPTQPNNLPKPCTTGRGNKAKAVSSNRKKLKLIKRIIGL